MNIISLENLNLADVVASLREGKTLVYPTETCYGLGCDATNSQAVEQIFHIKKREAGKSVLIVFPDVSMAMQYVEWNPVLEEIAVKYWPGALTAVVKVKSGLSLPAGIVGVDGTLAFRISSHPLVQEITKHLGAPIVSTSANIAGEDNPYDAEEIIKRFKTESPQPDVVIDAGILPYQSPSTIIKIENGKFQVLRQGEVQVE